jgi:hypothetical protein
MWDPSYWCPLIHESAHCLLLAVPDEFSVIRGELSKVITNIVSKPSAALRRVVTEIVVDLIQLNVAPFWKPQFVVMTYWDSVLSVCELSRLSKEQQVEFATRALLIWSAARTGPWVKGNLQEPQFNILELETQLLAEYQLLKDTKPTCHFASALITLHAECHNEIMSSSIALKPIVAFARNRLLFDANSAAERKSWWEGNDISLLLKKVSDGIPLDGRRIKFPELLIYKLREVYGEGMPEYVCAAVIWGLAERFRGLLLERRDAVLSSI